MTKSHLILFITALVFTACKKDAALSFYPKTFNQSQIASAYEFRVHDKTVTPPPPAESFYSKEYLNDEFSEVSFSLLNKDTLQLNRGNRSLNFAYILRNDTLYTAHQGPSNEFNPLIITWLPFAYGNQSQFTMINTHFSNTQVSLQDSLKNYPFPVQAGFSYKDYSFFTDTAALLTVTRVLK